MRLLCLAESFTERDIASYKKDQRTFQNSRGPTGESCQALRGHPAPNPAPPEPYGQVLYFACSHLLQFQRKFRHHCPSELTASRLASDTTS